MRPTRIDQKSNRSTRIDEQLKARLASELMTIIQHAAGTDRIDDAEFLDVHPTTISHLRSRRTHKFSLAWLFRSLHRLGYDFDIALRPRRPPVITREPASPALTVTRYDRFGQPVQS